MIKLPWDKIHWVNSSFLIGTFLATVFAVPVYVWHFGFDLFFAAMFLFFFVSSTMSITLGYHRLFSHLTFQARWPVKFYTLLFGAGAFEGSALAWCADHRRHHKFVDHEEDPYDISKGLFHAHIGWLLFRMGPDTPLTWVRDLQKDRMVMFQHRYFVPLAILMGFVVPTAIGYLWNGWIGALGGFLILGAARVVCVHHVTFCINSLCHWIGKRPYSGVCSARDSWIMAIFTMGEGYHNYHHEFQHDYRNGVKPWQWDPTKWMIWTLNKVGLVSRLRTVPIEKIMKAEIQEHERQLQAKLARCPHPLSDSLRETIDAAQVNLEAALARWQAQLEEYRVAAETRRHDLEKSYKEVKARLQSSADHLREAIEEWRAAHHFAIAELTAA